MNKVKTLLARVMVIAALVLPWSATEALETFEQAGMISSLGYDKFTVKGIEYRIAPGAKLGNPEPNRRKFSDFKRGDHVYFRGKVLNDVHYVDILYYVNTDDS